MAYLSPGKIDLEAPSLGTWYIEDETKCIERLLGEHGLSQPKRDQMQALSEDVIRAIRSHHKGTFIDAFLQEYGLSTREGIALMRLCEALIRTPDRRTANLLIRDKIGTGRWSEHVGKSSAFLVNLSTRSLGLAAYWIRKSGRTNPKSVIAHLGDNGLRVATKLVMNGLSNAYVFATSIENAAKISTPKTTPLQTYSFDMLGEGAHTAEDAKRYFDAYLKAAHSLAEKQNPELQIQSAPSLSVKLSALHPRYEYIKRDVCVPIIVERLARLCAIAKNAGFGITIDAEESDRLEISLEIFEGLAASPVTQNWQGLGFVVQAYQRRAPAVIERLIILAKKYNRTIAVRLVKGAYWDTEIKRAQDLGLESYPVFTRKENTDLSYLVCARMLLDAGKGIFPQFATHNAQTAAAIIAIAADSNRYEFQRLHGMGEGLHKVLMRDYGITSRVYAPVGKPKDLLPYLIRRLLENGANNAFVNQLNNPETSMETLTFNPVSYVESNASASHPKIKPPRDLFAGHRMLAKGADFTQASFVVMEEALSKSEYFEYVAAIIDGKRVQTDETRLIRSPTNSEIIGKYYCAKPSDVNEAVRAAQKSIWLRGFKTEKRAQCLNKAAKLLEENQTLFVQLCMREAGKTLPDAIAEVREAVDFCRYYANQASQTNLECRAPLGVVACISPWNFPLAIFIGQIVGALAAGNSVVAKPAEQTPKIAAEAVRLLHRAGIPTDAVNLIIGDGALLGNVLVRHPDVGAVCFTGSTKTAKIIANNLADGGRPLTPLIAETGGINAMIIDSTALLEQAVTDVIESAFSSAGQRCSACRIVCVQDDIADPFMHMLNGAMQELTVGDPCKLSTDVGPVIDKASYEKLKDYIELGEKNWPVVGQSRPPTTPHNGHFITPIAFEIDAISDLTEEVFGPILHVYRFNATEIKDVIDDINGRGYGLTMGLHTRIDSRVDDVVQRARVGNLYVNRNQIGAVVGVQPFGGEGLSGTGPKAGGPNYLYGLTKPNAPKHNVVPLISTERLPIAVGAIGDLVRIHDSVQANLSLDRATLFEKTKETLGDTHANLTDLICQTLCELREAELNAQTLNGPTGEENRLRYFPRGIIHCMGGPEPNDIVTQFLKAIATGNAVFISDQHAALDIAVLALLKSGLPQDLIQYSTDKENIPVIANVSAAVCDGPRRDVIAANLAKQVGPIIPILSKSDSLKRYCVERVVTINTTAAGGDTCLLAL